MYVGFQLCQAGHQALIHENTLTTSKRTPKTPQLVPVDVAFAIYAMWASLLLSAGFAIHELLVSASILDPMLRFAIFGGDLFAIRALPTKRSWARYVAVVLAVLFYALLAFDADGLTRNDQWHMLAKAPIDLFIISRLFSKSTSEWLAAR